MPPEVDALDFAPHVRVPVLMVNGRYDFGAPYETSQVPLFRLLGSAAPTRSTSCSTAATFPRGPTSCETLDWLDQRLGPVTAGPPPKR